MTVMATTASPNEVTKLAVNQHILRAHNVCLEGLRTNSRDVIRAFRNNEDLQKRMILLWAPDAEFWGTFKQIQRLVSAGSKLVNSTEYLAGWIDPLAQAVVDPRVQAALQADAAQRRTALAPSNTLALPPSLSSVDTSSSSDPSASSSSQSGPSELVPVLDRPASPSQTGFAIGDFLPLSRVDQIELPDLALSEERNGEEEELEEDGENEEEEEEEEKAEKVVESLSLNP
jgi:hypothetical protein